MATAELVCPVCGNRTDEDTPVEVMWCDRCRVPRILPVNRPKTEDACPVCSQKSKYLCKDARPVFPEERILLEILWGMDFGALAEKSIWASANRYYIDGKAKVLSGSIFKTTDTDAVVAELKRRGRDYPQAFFEKNIESFIEINADRLDFLVDEAHTFIQKTAAGFAEENVVISFSGGKDSTATQDLVVKALSNPSLVHIFGNTTLEFPTTIEYAERFRDAHPYAIFQIAENYEQNFMDVCEDIGPPARMMRWCCSMFKTGPITRILNGLYGDERVLTFYGIRKSESVSRSKYNRVEDDAESVKINKQTVASPIFFWIDLDVWLYILSQKIDFNTAYKYGYERVGCWLCPNNNDRDVFLSKIYMPVQYKGWREFLVRFAKRIGKPDPEEYTDSGAWKARQGGNGLASAEDIKIKFTNCTSEDHAKIYRLNRPFDDEFINMFVPFGRVAPELGQKLLHEVIVLDTRANVPILSLQPYEVDGYQYAVKIRTMNVADHEALQKQAAYQVRKFNACRKCLKCESVCRAGAISISGGQYYIDPGKCVHCKMCVTAKYLRGGCMMDKYLRTKE